jgi:hypothetical protein
MPSVAALTIFLVPEPWEEYSQNLQFDVGAAWTV